jgi:hypothetical protein
MREKGVYLKKRWKATILTKFNLEPIISKTQRR